MAFTANDLILDAAELYGDTAYDRIDADDWIRYLNAAIRTLILVRPDAGAVTEAVQLVAGIKQTLSAVTLRLLDITRNMGADGLTAGAIVTPTDRQHINYANLLWPAGTGDTAIENFSYDNNVPNVYYVTPPVNDTTAVYVEISSSQLPTAVTTTGSALGVNDIFFEPLLQFMMHKAFIADDEGQETAKAQQHFQNFLNLLGVELKSSSEAGPEKKE